MAEVFLASHRSEAGFEKLVVLKRPLPAGDVEGFAARLRREARLLAKLDHPGIAAVHEVGRDDEGLFVAMEYVEGHDLRAVIRRAATTGQRPSAAAAVALGIQVATALAHAHEKCDEHGRPLGVVHRDISPANIIVRPDGIVKLLDFGVARESAGPTITGPSELVGKLVYMSPEQIMRWTVDARADIFSLGVVLWELLALRRPFANDHVALMREIPTVDVPSILSVRPDLPRDLDRVLAGMLERDPDRRYPDAASVVGDLKAIGDGKSGDVRELAVFVSGLFEAERRPRGDVAPAVEVTPTITVGSSAIVRPGRRRRALAWGGAVLLVGGLVGSGVWIAAVDREPAPRWSTPSPEPMTDATAGVEPAPAERPGSPAVEVEPGEPLPTPAAEHAGRDPEEPSRQTRRRSDRPRKRRRSGDRPRDALDPVLPPGYGARTR